MGADRLRKFVGDFETTVYENQTKTEVWASAMVEIGDETDDVKIFHSLPQTFRYIAALDCNAVIYYHNLKFDGAFWIDYLIREQHFTQAYTEENDDFRTIEWIKKSDMKNNTFRYLISETGMFYSLLYKFNGKYIELRDSYKLLPFSVAAIGESFKTKHRKLEMKYEGFRYAGCTITDKEKEYIANDVLVVKEALEIMFTQGHDKLTIGSCCMSEFKATFYRDDFAYFFPDLRNYALDKDTYGSENADEYIRKSYKGGWCYVNPKFQSKEIRGGYTLDVNSLYPSMMHSSSGNVYPIGTPTFWKGERPVETYNLGEHENYYFFIRVKVKFHVKKGHLPFIQVKNSFMYKANRALTTSNYIDRDGNEHAFFIKNGEVIPCFITLTLTQTDYFLMLEHYDIDYMEVLDGCYFHTASAMVLFDQYIEKYKKIKMTSTGALRTLAKLFLNNLYGKLATSEVSSFKVAYLDEKTNIVKFFTVPRKDKDVVYIPIGSAITSYARNFTIRAAQANFPNFIYADTDSIHCKGSVDKVKGVKLDDAEFCCWKHESDWDLGYFTRQKTYIERVEIDGEKIYDIKCAGMPKKCKNLFIRSLTGELAKDGEELTEDERIFLSKKRELTDFDIGLVIPGKLKPKRIEGGIILVEEDYTMRDM